MITAWNTGRQYSKHGQRMSAQTVNGGIVFVDIDRGIDGFFPTVNEPRDTYGLRSLAMTAYDHGNYKGAFEFPVEVRACRIQAELALYER